MPHQKVDIQIFPPFRGKLSRLWLRRVVQKALAAAQMSQPCRVGLVIADDDTVRRLNRDYRGLDEVTDVLAFSFRYPGHYEGDQEPEWLSEGNEPFVTPAGEVETLGEVVLCYNQAVRQAQEQGHTTEREMALLIAHGVLHLLGHDHGELTEAQAMRSLEQKALADLLGRVAR